MYGPYFYYILVFFTEIKKIFVYHTKYAISICFIVKNYFVLHYMEAKFFGDHI